MYQDNVTNENAYFPYGSKVILFTNTDISHTKNAYFPYGSQVILFTNTDISHNKKGYFYYQYWHFPYQQYLLPLPILAISHIDVYFLYGSESELFTGEMSKDTYQEPLILIQKLIIVPLPLMAFCQSSR